MRNILKAEVGLKQYPNFAQKIYQDLNLRLLQQIGLAIEPFEYDFVYSHMPIKPMQASADPRKLAKNIFRSIKERSTFYIHVPFCERNCSYCYFYKKTNYKKEDIDLYLKYLKKEFLLLRNIIGNFSFIDSLYIGGGTPSILSESQMEYLFNIFSPDMHLQEIALEMHPETITKSKLLFLKQAGATRISFGIQTFDDDLLRLMNRGVSKKEILEKIKLVENLFDNWNVDLIYGLPYQTKFHITQDIEQVLNIKPPSITWYEVWFSPRKEEIKIPINNIPKNRFMTKIDFIKTKIFIDETLKEGGYINFYNDWYVLDKKYSTIYEEYKIKSHGNIGIGLGIYEYYNKYTFENESNWKFYYLLLDKNKIPIRFYTKMNSRELFIKRSMMGLKGLIPFSYERAKKYFPDEIKKRMNNLIKNKIFIVNDDGLVNIENKYQILRDHIIIYMLGGYGWKIRKIL